MSRPGIDGRSHATGAGRGRSMLAFRSVVSVLLRELGDFFSTPSRPALRPGSAATVTEAPAPPFSAAGADAAA
jgi:hypothetical protein